MIKRFASHFIFLPGHGYLKQYVVGVEEGQVVSAFPLTEEIEGVEWFPGVIALLNNEEDVSINDFEIPDDIIVKIKRGGIYEF